MQEDAFLPFAEDLVDWSVADTDLLTIRSTDAFARTLRPMPEGEAQAYEVGTTTAVAILLLSVAFLSRRIVGRGAFKRFEALEEKRLAS